MRNYYEDLSLPLCASIEEVRKQFRLLALEHHPDKNLDDKEAHQRFIIINEAYQFLNNSEEKKEYDQSIALYILKKSSESVNNTFDESINTDNYRPPYARYDRKKHYKYSKENLARNQKGTIYAFAMVFSVLLVVFTISVVANYLEDKRLATLNRELFAIKKSIFDDFSQGRYESGFVKADSIFRIEKYIATHSYTEILKTKQNIIYYLTRLSKLYLDQHQAKHALPLLKLVLRYGKKNAIEVYQLIALASKELGHYHDAITAWKYIERHDEPTFETSAQVGLIYTYYLYDYKKGLISLLRARVHAIDMYRRIFGKGYTLAFLSSMIPDPENHFKVFFALSLCYYHLGNLKEAHNMLTWVKRINLHQEEYYFLKGLIYQKEKNKYLSCINLDLATENGHQGAKETWLEYCN